VTPFAYIFSIAETLSSMAGALPITDGYNMLDSIVVHTTDFWKTGCSMCRNMLAGSLLWKRYLLLNPLQ
jgi:hypothetical protein